MSVERLRLIFNRHIGNRLYALLCQNGGKKIRFYSAGRKFTLQSKSRGHSWSWEIMCRYYCQGPGIVMLSGGVSKLFTVDALGQKDELLRKVVEQLNEDHAMDVCVVETSEERKKYADYVVVVSGGSTRHLRAMTNHLYEQSKKKFTWKHATASGLESDDWMVVDFGSVVVHLFLPDVRAKYDLEKLWSLGPGEDEQYQAMLEEDQFLEILKNAKLEDFFIKEKIKDEPAK